MASSQLMRCDCGSTALLENNQTAILNGHWWKLILQHLINHSTPQRRLKTADKWIMCLSFKTMNELHSISHQDSFRVSSSSCSDLHRVFVVVMSQCWLWYWQRHYKNQTVSSSAQINETTYCPACLLGDSLTLTRSALKPWNIHSHKFTGL